MSVNEPIGATERVFVVKRRADEHPSLFQPKKRCAVRWCFRRSVYDRVGNNPSRFCLKHLTEWREAKG